MPSHFSIDKILSPTNTPALRTTSVGEESPTEGTTTPFAQGEKQNGAAPENVPPLFFPFSLYSNPSPALLAQIPPFFQQFCNPQQIQANFTHQEFMNTTTATNINFQSKEIKDQATTTSAITTPHIYSHGIPTAFGQLQIPPIPTSFGQFPPSQFLGGMFPSFLPNPPNSTFIGATPQALGYLPQQLSGKRKRRHRTIFNEDQLKLLEERFSQTQYPDVGAREAIGARIGLKDERVEVWFKNRRAKERKKTNVVHSPNITKLTVDGRKTASNFSNSLSADDPPDGDELGPECCNETVYSPNNSPALTPPNVGKFNAIRPDSSSKRKSLNDAEEVSDRSSSSDLMSPKIKIAKKDDVLISAKRSRNFTSEASNGIQDPSPKKSSSSEKNVPLKHQIGVADTKALSDVVTNTVNGFLPNESFLHPRLAFLNDLGLEYAAAHLATILNSSAPGEIISYPGLNNPPVTAINPMLFQAALTKNGQ